MAPNESVAVTRNVADFEESTFTVALNVVVAALGELAVIVASPLTRAHEYVYPLPEPYTAVAVVEDVVSARLDGEEDAGELVKITNAPAGDAETSRGFHTVTHAPPSHRFTSAMFTQVAPSHRFTVAPMSVKLLPSQRLNVMVHQTHKSPVLPAVGVPD